MINKTNHELIIQNFTFVIREIHTQIILQTLQNISVTYRHTDTIRLLYIDDESYLYHIPIGVIPASPVDPNLNFNISNWYNINGQASTLKDEVAKGIYKIRINASIDVGIYGVSVFVKLPNYLLATYSMSINITKAETVIIPNVPATIFSAFDVFQLLTTHFSVKYTNEFGEPILNGTLHIEIRIGGISGALITRINLNYEGNGIYGVELSTNNLTAGQTYTIIVYASPNDKNYDITFLMYPSIFTVKPFWEHWAFILSMVVLAVVVGVAAYRQIKWYLTPYQVKAIIRATKLIKKGKAEAVTSVLMSRDEMFKTEFGEPWGSIDLKPPKLMQPDIILFASEMSAILRTRMITTEAETIVHKLRTMSLQEAERYLSEMKVPPEANRRLLTIVGLISKERIEIINFAQALGTIKGTEITYSQAEEIMNVLQAMTPFDADKYLEAMVIPHEQRKQLLDIVGIKPYAGPKKLKEPTKEKEKEKEKIKEKPKEEPMNVSEIRNELNKITGLSNEEKDALVKDMEKLSLKEQKEILKNLRG
jgi:hypothetical protein